MDEIVIASLAGTRNGKPLLVTTPTRCDPPATGEVYLGLVSGTRDGKPLVAFSTQRCDGAESTLAVGRGYLGLLSGTRNGKPLLVVPCGPCAGGDLVICGCDVAGGLCLTVEGTTFAPDPAISNLAMEGDFELYEATWEDVVAEVKYNVTCIDTTDPEDPVTVSDDWFTGAGELLADQSDCRWFWTEWQTKTDGIYVGPGPTDTAPVEWRHVLMVCEDGCTFQLFTFYSLNGDHVAVRDWCNEDGSSIFYYSLEEENETGFCLTATNAVTQTDIVGECDAATFSCGPFLREQNIDGAWPGGGLLWDTDASDFTQITVANWSFYACEA